MINQDDVSGSWRTFFQDFVLAIELRELELDTRYTTNLISRIVALLGAVRKEGKDFLQSVGFDIRQGTYKKALNLLDDHYGRKESIFVKTQKFCFARQTAGEDEQRYFVRVERLSRDADLGTTDKARRRLCLVLATNDLRDVNLQRELMARSMDWAEFARILRSRAVASQAVQILNEDTENTMSFKKEVGAVKHY